MYKQLLTYEIRAQVRSDVRILAALVAVVAASIGVRALDIPGLSASTEILAYALCVAMPVVVAIVGLVDYWKTLYGQRGYFTMSLPASGAQIFWAKITRMALACLAALPFMVCGLVAMAATSAWTQGLSLSQYTAPIRSALAPFSTSVLLALVAAQLFSCFCWVVQCCAAMSIGAQGRFNHMGFGAPIIGFVLLYIVNQVLSTVGTFFVPLSVTTDGHFSTEIMWTSYQATLGTDGHPNVIGIGSYVLVPLFALIMGLWASRSIEKHTSLR